MSIFSKTSIVAVITIQNESFKDNDHLSSLHCTRNEVFLWIWSHLLKKSLMENFIFCAVLVSTCSFSVFFAAQQFRFSTLLGKVRRLKKAWVRFPEHSIQNFPIFYYLQLDTNPFKKKTALFIALTVIVVKFCFYQSEEIHFYLLTNLLTNSIYNGMMFKVNCKFLKNCAYNIAQIFTAETLNFIMKAYDLLTFRLRLWHYSSHTGYFTIHAIVCAPKTWKCTYPGFDPVIPLDKQL